MKRFVISEGSEAGWDGWVPSCDLLSEACIGWKCNDLQRLQGEEPADLGTVPQTSGPHFPSPWKQIIVLEPNEVLVTS